MKRHPGERRAPEETPQTFTHGALPRQRPPTQNLDCSRNAPPPPSPTPTPPQGGGREGGHAETPDPDPRQHLRQHHQMGMNWEMRPFWSWLMHSAIHTMLRTWGREARERVSATWRDKQRREREGGRERERERTKQRASVSAPHGGTKERERAQSSARACQRHTAGHAEEEVTARKIDPRDAQLRATARQSVRAQEFRVGAGVGVPSRCVRARVLGSVRARCERVHGAGASVRAGVRA
jgi:hypothetical protein